MKLYELSTQYAQLQQLADDPDIDLTDTLEGLTGEIELKANGLMQVVRGIESDIDAVDAENPTLMLWMLKLNACRRSRRSGRTGLIRCGIISDTTCRYPVSPASSVPCSALRLQRGGIRFAYSMNHCCRKSISGSR